ncbi:MAG: WD40 repeat domain-containing protein [Bryobacteraceae bacterium]|nr:WD40 repeat domain-containing protein [Bryobacteraceae bacterium]
MSKLTIWALLALAVLGIAVFVVAPRGAHYRFHTEKERGFTFSPDGTRFAMWEQNTLRIYDTGSTRERAVLPFRERGLGFTADAQHFVSINRNEELTVRNADSGDELFRAPRFAEHVTEIACSRNGALAVGGVDGTVHLYELPTGKSGGSFRADSSNLRAFALSSDGRQLVSSGSDGLCFWDVTTRTRRHALQPNFRAWRLAFSPDGSVLCAFDSKGCRLYDAATAAERPCERPEWFEDGDWASALAFSPDGRTLLAGNESVVGLWDVRTGANAHRFPKSRGELLLRRVDRWLLCNDPMDTNPYLEDGTITSNGDVMMVGTIRQGVVVWRLASVDVR